MRIMRKMRSAKPAVFKILKTRDGMRLRVTASIPTKSSRPPSRAGKGRRLMIERLSEMSAVKERR